MGSTVTSTGTDNGSSLWRWGAVAAAAAGLVNLTVFLLARVADVSFLVTMPERGEQEIAPVVVVGLSVVPILAGTAIAAVLVTRIRRATRITQGIGIVLALASLMAPLSLDAPTSTRLVPSAMHLVVGAAFVLGLERGAR